MAELSAQNQEENQRDTEVPVLDALVTESIKGKHKIKDPSRSLDVNIGNVPDFIENYDNHFDYVSQVLNTNVKEMDYEHVKELEPGLAKDDTLEDYLNHLWDEENYFDGIAEGFEEAAKALEELENGGGPYLQQSRFKDARAAYTETEKLINKLEEAEDKYVSY